METSVEKLLSPSIFRKDPFHSIFYMLLDGMILSGLFYLHNVFFLKYAFLLPVYWNLMGFFMWCLFVVGHDCGHGTFSDSKLLNDVCGHLCHAPLLVPYYPWRLSHRSHHAYHNHIDKDLSHPWMRQETHEHLHWMKKKILDHPLLNFITFTIIYLWIGLPDGSHIYPFSSLFPTILDRIQCVISTLTTIAAFFYMYWLNNMNLIRCGSSYIIPLLFFNFWLTMVTFLQHHHDGTIAHDDKTWTFRKGAVETIDRSYGVIVDTLSHHITSDHVSHHLYPSRIPHYNLHKATKMISSRLGNQYKNIPTPYFVSEFLRLHHKLQYMIRNEKEEYVYPSSESCCFF